MSYTFKNLLVWLGGSFVVLLMAINFLPATRMADGSYVPLTNDSFYHARRIIDAINGPLYQFDRHIHVPEGSWLTWPWAYDLGMAYITKIGMALTGIHNAMAIMAYLPLVIALINTGLLLALTAALGLTLPLRAIALACFAFSPLTQTLHAVGQIDHHNVELSFVLLSLWLGLRWAQQPDDGWRAAALGTALGLAPAFHTGLFMLQLPLLGTLGIAWLKGKNLAFTNLLPLMASVLLATLVALLPSEPFWELQFSFYTLSWFHLYAACATILMTALFSLRRTLLTGILMAAAGGMTVLAITHHLVWGTSFLFSKTHALDGIMETRSVLNDFLHLDVLPWVKHYSALLLLLPFAILLHAVLLFRDKDLASLWFSVWVIFGSGLLLQQYRLHYYGSFALYLPLLLWLNRSVPIGHKYRLTSFALLSLLLVLSYFPVRERLFPAMLAPAAEYDYFITQSLYPALNDACASHPGVVLASATEGHYIRYHTNCDVIANNFIMDPLHIRKIQEVEHLLSLNAAQLRQAAPEVRYLLLLRNGSPWNDISSADLKVLNPGLRGELLLHDGPFPDGFQLLKQIEFDNGAQSDVMARLFYILPR